MDSKKFLKAKQEWDTKKPFSAERHNALCDEFRRCAQPEHAPVNVGKFMSDKYTCTCGWTSNGYWDGASICWNEWLNHVAEACYAEQGVLSPATLQAITRAIGGVNNALMVQPLHVRASGDFEALVEWKLGECWFSLFVAPHVGTGSKLAQQIADHLGVKVCRSGCDHTGCSKKGKKKRG